MAKPKTQAQTQAKNEPRLKSYHFDCGNSTRGHIGFCARVRAHTRREALEIMRRVLPDEVKIHPCGDDADNARVEYIEAYISPQNITLRAVDDEEAVE